MARVAVVQFDPHLADTTYNLNTIESYVERAAVAGAELVVFPECAVSGYVYESLEEARQVAQPVPGPAADRIARTAAQLALHVVFGMLELAGSRVYNSAVLAGPGGILGVYRKTHTLCLGVDRFTAKGEGPYEVYDLPFGRLGMLICYDLRFPEAARVLALQGAEIIALPTNWPRSSHIQPDAITRVRAAENRVFLLAADRVGRERTAHFLGRSQIVDPDGAILMEAGMDEPELLTATIDPARAANKHIVVSPGVHEMDAFADRRPDLYGSLVRDMVEPS